MHHFVYPTQDSYISNKLTEKEYNFGLDEMLVIGVNSSYSKVVNNTKDYTLSNEYVYGMNLLNYSGKHTGSFFGRSIVNGSLLGTTNNFTASYFSGSVTGSLSGTETGSSFTGQFSGSLRGFNGLINSYAVNGSVTGSVTSSCFGTFTGTLTGFSGSLTGYLTGIETKNEQNVTITNKPFINRSLIKFDLSSISSSILSGDIVNPTYWLKIKATEARELPSTYIIYAFPVSQSWVQGNGYFSDGGSTHGVSWNWRDEKSGSSWFSPYTTSPITSSVNYLSNYNYVSESFKRGGGTWHNIPCSQSFGYEVADINMNVTPIVSAWLSGTRNEGFILMMSEEVSLTSSNSHIFYFSKETNTIFMPKLDVVWDDSSYVTGSFGTGSVSIVSYSPGISGSMTDSSSVTTITASGNFGGNAYLMFDTNTVVLLTGSVIDSVGVNGTVGGLRIDGRITGSTVSSSVSGLYFITGSMISGDFSGSQIFAQYSGSQITGFLSGSFIGRFFSDHKISGSLPDAHNFVLKAYQNSPAQGNIVGYQISGTPNSAQLTGVITDGMLKGGIASIYITGSNCYVTSSFSVTSSVEITGSSIKLIDVNKPFVVVLQDLKKEYSFGDIPRINVFAREKFPLKSFGKAPQQPVYTTPMLLPSSSFYSIKDSETEEIIIDFDNYTKISCEPNGHFFHLDTTGLEKERYYKILVRVVFDSGKSYTFDSFDLFKIRR